MSVRALLGETWRLVRSRGPAMVIVALVFLVPAELALAYAEADSQTVGIAASVVLYLVGYAWVFAALMATLDRRARAPVAPYGLTADRVPALALVNLVAGIAIGIGILLLVVPGLLLAARWSVVGPLIVLERQGLVEAFETSNRLVRGRTWPVAGATALVLVATFVLAIPGVLVTELTEPAWAEGLGDALLDVALFVPTAAFAYAVYLKTAAGR